MSHRRIWLSAACILFLVGCENNNNNPTKSLQSPDLRVNSTNDGLIWDPVEGASYYEITVDEETEEVNFPGYYFETEYGDYEVSVVAKNDKGESSKETTFSYETRVTRLGNLQFDGTTITWPGSDYYALEYSINDSEYITISENFLTVSESGIYYFRTVKGFKEANHVYYGQVISRCIVVTTGSPTPYVLEDGSSIDDATLNEYYRKMKYTSGWEVAASYLTLDDTSEDYVTGNAVDYHTWYHGMFYMFEKDIALNGKFNEFDFTIKSGDSITVIFSFQITHTLIINGIDLNGVYIKYTLSESPVLWHNYRVSMSDSNWKVNYGGQDYDASTIITMINQAGIKVQSISDMFPFFDVFQLRIKASYSDSGSSAHTYVDDVQLLNSDLEQTEIKEIIPNLELQKNYAFKGDLVTGSMNVYSENHMKFNITTPVSLEMDASYVIEDEVLIVTSEKAGQDFVARFVSSDGGLTLALESVTGSFAQYLIGIQAECITCLNDFESYTETGVGYDANNPEENRSGLRGDFICDYYSGSDNDYSPIGGKKWNLMRSTDYMYLSDTVAHTGSKSLNIKSSSNTMRFMSWGLHDGSATGVRGRTFSFWAKGGDKKTITMRVGVYSVKEVGPSNHTDLSVKEQEDITIEINSDWTLYTIELDRSKLYYGFTFINLGPSDGMSGSQRIYVDDIYVYNTLSPWAA